jgi:hypothetical protein
MELDDPLLGVMASEVAETVEQCEDFEQMFQRHGQFAIDNFQSLADHVQTFKGILRQLVMRLESQNSRLYIISDDIKRTLKKCVNFVLKHTVWSKQGSPLLVLHLRSARSEASKLVDEIGRHEKTIQKYLLLLEKSVHIAHQIIGQPNRISGVNGSFS